MLLKKLIAGAGLVGALGATTPALADWYQPAPTPPVYVTPPAVQYGYGYGDGYYRWNDGDHDRDDWRWRRHRWHEWREHEWREHEWREHHPRPWW